MLKNLLLIVSLLSIGGFLGLAVFQSFGSLHVSAPDVQASIGESGVLHPVTAVLLNFRAFDTLFEVVVLFVAFITFLGLIPAAKHGIFFRPGGMPKFLVRTLTPFFLTGGVYLLLIGSKGPGGAFQAATLFATLIIFHRLSGHGTEWMERLFVFRYGVAIGLGVFLFVGSLSLLWGEFFTFRGDTAGYIILLVEFFLTLSIALILAGFFIGNEPDRKKQW